MADMSPADYAAMTGGLSGGFGGGSSWLWIIVLLFLFGGFNGGWNGNNRDYATKADVYEGLYDSSAFNKLDNMTTQMTQGFSNTQLQNCQGFNGVNTNVLQQANASNVLALQNTASISQQLDNNRFAGMQDACDIRATVIANQTEGFKNTCSILDAIRDDGEKTRAVLVANKVADLEEKLAEARRAGQTTEIENSQLAQTSAIINAIRPYPVPAYQTLSPYMSNYYAQGGYGFNTFV